jgi:hypothetical protein
MDSNTSGHGVAAEVPTDLRRWNWGAFLLNWIWGLGNNTYIALLMFVPVVNFVMPFVLGAKGSAWAWRNKHWESVEQFKHVQRLWTIWGALAWIAMIALSIGIWFSVVAMFKQSEPYQMAIARLQANAEATRALGAPITTGAPMGNISISGPSGRADLQFSVEGPKGKGTVYLRATKELGVWKLNRIELELEGSRARINLSDGESGGERVRLEVGPTAAARLALVAKSPQIGVLAGT